MNYGEWVRIELFRLKLTQIKLSKHLKLSDRTIRYKIKDNRFTDEEQAKINKYLKDYENK